MQARRRGLFRLIYAKSDIFLIEACLVGSLLVVNKCDKTCSGDHLFGQRLLELRCTCARGAIALYKPNAILHKTTFSWPHSRGCVMTTLLY